MNTLSESFHPSSDLKYNYEEISRLCRENKEAVIITARGRCDTVSLSYEEYKRLKERLFLLETLMEAEDDVKNGRVAPISQTFEELRNILKANRH